MQEGKEACSSEVCGWICSLKAQIFPVVSMEGTVKLGASQLLIDGLQDSAMHGVLAIQATLSDGQDQVPFFTEALVELRRPEEVVPEGSKPSPSDGGLDSFLEGGEVHCLEMLQGLTEGDELPRLVHAGPAPCLWVDAVHSFPFFLGLEDFCTHNTGLPAIRLCCQGLEDAVVLQL